jgi:[ribosomal protein S18]-alanine N-acetyltransferase
MSAELRPRRLAELGRIRTMTLADVVQVGEIERHAYQFPWSEGVFRDCIRVGYICRVLEVDGNVGGYGVMSYGAGEAHVLNVSVRADLRSSGLGRRMMNYLIERARVAGMQDVFLEVRPSNPIALALYKSLGFLQIGVRKGYYQCVGGREDAWVFKRALERPTA